ncbi:DUF397 domain-containing protein [Streptomyces albireticuli]|uniref:DUF397 domain-containing protein n=1 Tax=Streptomyces albireticuli TaxID=1940 RepID=A0A2A2CXX5_9ACTN|nr:DUF397 domain-containing protein [Streptomyces albireticuli]MCD9143064.1 DUF397 domain-containing protein [Streptomyces albireticuli]MCD9165307.1 DUF397 domain-containing protein [Streptomyces albireticuli]MCD9192175.1 DUF397 domain-containing protein [Streptomyces albireticuli]PAU44047.1 DUF397 domain-containing protein [Streptomyces albireticuli]
MSSYIWQKSTFSGAGSNCLNIAAEWQTSSYSYEGANCLNLASAPDRIFLRESDDPTVILNVSPKALRALIRTLKRD